MVATSFDGQTDLLSKYPESKGILANLRAMGVTVLHNVDATAVDERVFLKPDKATSGGGEARQRNPGEKGGVCPGEDSELSTVPNDETRQAGGASLCGYRPRQKYDHIVFNHPHTGTEDMRRHRSFLGHFFHAVLNANVSTSKPTISTTASAADLIQKNEARIGCRGTDAIGTNPSNALAEASEHVGVSILALDGAVHVTLAGDQPERWGLREQAARHGFALAHRRRFPAEQIDGYMTKRHQTGRSFQRRNLDSVTLSFVWVGGACGSDQDTGMNGPLAHDPCNSPVSTAGEVLGNDPGRSIERVGKGIDGTEEIDGEGRRREEKAVYAKKATTISSNRALPPWLWPEVNMCTENSEWTRGTVVGKGDCPGGEPAASCGGEVLRAVGTAGIDDQCGINHGNGSRRLGRGSDPSALLEVCTLCGKRYKTPQALRTHVRQQHELGQGGGAAGEGEEHRCPCCDRIFSSKAALDQHIFAKHRGQNVDIKPDWYVGSIYHFEPPHALAEGKGKEADNVFGGSSLRTCAADVGHGNEREDTDASGLATGACRLQTAPASGSFDSTQATLGGIGRGDQGVSYCGVCGFWFMTPEDAQQHLDNLRPPIEGRVTRFECGLCAKGFGSRRALLQHANFCGRVAANTELR